MAEHTLLKEINKKSIGTYIKSLPEQLWFYEDFFPAEQVDELKYETLIGAEARPVAADIVPYNTSAPKKSRPVVDKLTGTIPAIRVKREMTEDDLNTYNQLQRLADPNQQKLLNLVFDDPEFVWKSVRGRLEWLALKIVSYPLLTLTRNTNVGIVTESEVDFQMPSANKLAASIKWDATAATTKPITDFIAARVAAKAIGVTLQYVLMDETDWGYFAASTETKNYVYGTLFGGAGLLLTPNIADANRMLTAQALPTIIIVDQSITVEDENFSQTTGNPWTTGYVTFIPDLQLGTMKYGPIAEETNKPEQVVQTKQNGIIISKWSDTDPVAEFTKGETNAFPSWANVDYCFNMIVNATIWA